MKHTNISPHLEESFQEKEINVVEVEPLELIHTVLEAGLDAKGSDCSVLDMREISDISDYYVVFSGRSDRHVQGICNKILAKLDEESIELHSVEGFDKGHWVLIDLYDVLIHIFYQPKREEYDLEGLWTRAKKLPLKDEAFIHHTVK